VATLERSGFARAEEFSLRAIRSLLDCSLIPCQLNYPPNFVASRSDQSTVLSISLL
jgi:hypothetical protein